MKCRTVSPEWKRNSCIEANRVQNKKRGPNKLEAAGERILQSLGVDFKTQVLIDEKFLVDAVVDEDIVIQWDGDYWHGFRASGDNKPLIRRQTKRRGFDKSQDAYMRRRGYAVVRFWEHDVHGDPELVSREIKKATERTATKEA